VSSPLLSTSQKDPEESPLGPVARLETETAGNAWKRRANAWKRLEHPPKTYFFGSHVSPGGVQRLFGSDGGGPTFVWVRWGGSNVSPGGVPRLVGSVGGGPTFGWANWGGDVGVAVKESTPKQ
jgi:hypothetical protein